MKYGTEIDTAFIDEQGSSVQTIKQIKDHEVKKMLKRTCIRVRVRDKKEEMTEYLLFSDLLEQKREAGTLILNDKDPANRPSFVIEFPKFDMDGAYFIIRSFTELML